jgi:hypothetical protein
MIAGAAMCLGLLAGCAAAQVPHERASDPAAVAKDAPAPHASADALLEALEKATRGLRDFQAQVIYDRLDAITEDRERRTGRIILEQDGADPPQRRFAIAFDRFIDAAGHASPQNQRFAFASGWLVEFDDARRQAIERQLVPEGKSLDPLRLGEGPLPLPVGQRADDVRRRFTATLAPAPEAPLLKALDGVQGLVLVPRAGTSVSEDFEEVRIWYDLRTLAPVGVLARMKGGDLKTVLLRNVQVNAGLDPSALEALRVEVPEGWVRDRRPWRPAQP